MTSNKKYAIIKPTNEGILRERKDLTVLNYYATITFKINKNHPMWEGSNNNQLSEKTYEFEDLYRDNNNLYSKDYMHDLIREDLLLIAGGENYTESISDVDIKIYQTTSKTLAEYRKKVNAVADELSKAINRDKLEKEIDLLFSKIWKKTTTNKWKGVFYEI